MSRPKHVLFVCEGNLHRSPTAEELYASTKGLRVRSAGTSSLARSEIDEELLDWADVVCVMEPRLLKVLKRRFPDQLAGKSVVALDIPDDFQRMQPELVALLTNQLTPHLGPPERGS
jgi:predicted protein tyrosine phosphatase